ncbi:MAG: hypothetical protein U5L74_07200 [Ideonella sp.]|nr:hypothetical protein [Ideonella sp.]
MTLQWNKRLATAMLAIAGFIGMLAPAQAVIITTNYDPNFGAGRARRLRRHPIN